MGAKSRRKKSRNYSGMDPQEVYRKWHWNVAHSTEKDIDDDDLPEYLVETGRLVELHYRPVGSERNPKRKDKILKLPRKQSNRSHLAFDPSHEHERLYIVLDPKTEKKVQKNMWNGSDFDPMELSELSDYAGGIHATDDYPDVEVKPVGILTAVVYATEKHPDGYSFYIHHMGEESGIQPALACDEQGRLWIAGGDYTSPIPGITN